MTEYKHHVSGFFVKRAEAQIAYAKLIDRGLTPDQLRIYDNETAAREPAPDANSNTALKSLIVDGAVGAAVGTGIGVLAEVALVVANVSLFIASPLLAPLAMLGWGASLGGVIGAVIGSESTDKKDGKFADLVQDAIMNGVRSKVMLGYSWPIHPAKELRHARTIIERRRIGKEISGTSRFAKSN